MNSVEMHIFYIKGDWMNIETYPQFHLYLLTLNIFMLKEDILPENCDERCVNATIINRAYYSSYLFCLLWLKCVKKFKPKAPWEFKKDEHITGEHKQVRNALYDFGEEEIQNELIDLAALRKKADYEPFADISQKEVNDAINHMEEIFKHLKFE